MTTPQTKRSFAEHIGESFQVRSDGAELQDLVLFEVTRLDSDTDRPFSLFFRGPLQTRLPQKIYTLHHPALESLDLFLVPVGIEAGHVIYEALFN